VTWFSGGAPQPGDWIKTTKRVKVSLTDYLLGDGAGVPPGTRGVITETTGLFNIALTAQLDGGLFGPVTVRLRPDQVRVIRRGGGLEAYRESAHRRALIRSAAVIATLGPIVIFAARYLAAGGSKGALLVALMNGVFYGVLNTVEYGLTNPMNGLIYCGIVWLIGRLAFGRW
jgi:hypothetical protein